MQHDIRRALPTPVAIVLVIVIAAAAAPAAEPEADAALAPAAATPPAGAAASQAMEAMMKAAAPGPSHELLGGLAGTWTFSNVMRMDPAQPAMASTGRAVKKMILGDRYLVEDSEGTLLGQPLRGVGTTGFDNVQKKFVGTWIDSAGTGIAILEATSSDGKTLNGTVRFADPMTGEMATVRTVTRIESPDRHVFEWWPKGPDGKEYLGMAITYERQAPAGR